jgi:hypothetical protein
MEIHLEQCKFHFDSPVSRSQNYRSVPLTPWFCLVVLDGNSDEYNFWNIGDRRIRTRRKEWHHIKMETYYKSKNMFTKVGGYKYIALRGIVLLREGAIFTHRVMVTQFYIDLLISRHRTAQQKNMCFVSTLEMRRKEWNTAKLQHGLKGVGGEGGFK